ncbi:1-acyl-sn-glycerol-3-phosphate acyltransferase [Guyparkeria hydrothermalis]|uniref:lysophospholipid acyltransferase family protein n=1 Tax=Guyparkeria TaxID=2035712 RepID=UPI0010AD4B3D|nr:MULTISPECIES: lysophospholipid acyltransferase family protein [Guyparkeria]MCL7752100.1 1-acyl-sn-glycerol-3-phosphate acyltransferase [Guyparkeria hydrothermalis]TKA91297.1 1-acyl-sn-glycerol-3-phosphate acyltransferase [Guyparkeria sp. SB14A]
MAAIWRALSRGLRLLAYLVAGLWHARRLAGLDEAARSEQVRAWLDGAARVLGVRVRVEGRERLSDLPSGSLWLPNHVSWLDIPLLGGLQGGTVFLAKSEIRHWPVIGRLARLAGTEFIERGRGSEAAGEAVERGLRHGRQMVVFAEGTTTNGHTVRRFHARLLGAAVRLERPVVPIALRYFDVAGNRSTAPAFIDNESLWPSLWRVLSGKGLEARIDVLEPIVPRPDETRSELARRAHRAVSAHVTHREDQSATPGSSTDG